MTSGIQEGVGKMKEMLDELRKPFHPSHVEWKPGAVKGDKALAMPYADPRAYMNRLDEVCGIDWSVAYEPWGTDRLICRLTIGGITRSSTGESDKDSEKNEIGGTVAEAQSFKRACAMFGLGRYLYNLPAGWADYDPATRKFTDKAKVRLMGILVQHYRRATEGGDTRAVDTTTGEIVDSSPTVPATKDSSNPFNDTTPYYVTAWRQLTGTHYDFVNWIRQLHLKGEQCSKAQYGLVTGIVDALTNNEHNYALSVLCQSEISKTNMPSLMVAKALLSRLQVEIPAVGEDGKAVKDEEGKIVKVANPDYRADMAQIVTDIAAQMVVAESVEAP